MIHACGSKAGGDVICWGDAANDKLAVPADTTFTAFAVGDYHACARKTDGAVACWGGPAPDPMATDPDVAATPPDELVPVYKSAWALTSPVR